MSFILDALRKSENERQQQADAEFATVPSASDSPGAPRWLWILGILLVLNVAVLVGIFMRPDTPAEQVRRVRHGRVAVARRNQPEPVTAEPIRAAPSASEPAAQTEPLPVSIASIPQSDRAILPTLTEVRVDGTLTLPDLHVDVHVYSDTPSERFVYINMNKYRERQTIDEGPVIQEITRDGVILNYLGTAFILPRR